MVQRLFRNWVYGGMLAGVLLLLLSPLLIGSWPLVLALTFLHLPVYMLHQFEEHDDDRFRRFVNARLGPGKGGLSPAEVFAINVPGVWGVIAISLYLAKWVNVGLALIAVYLVLVNGVIHIAQGAIGRNYNPGLITAILLFLPLGGYTLWQVHLAGGGSWVSQAVGLGSAVAIHGAIVGFALRKN